MSFNMPPLLAGSACQGRATGLGSCRELQNQYQGLRHIKLPTETLQTYKCRSCWPTLVARASSQNACLQFEAPDNVVHHPQWGVSSDAAPCSCAATRAVRAVSRSIASIDSIHCPSMRMKMHFALALSARADSDAVGEHELIECSGPSASTQKRFVLSFKAL
jgi:hypothetical protein